MPNISIMYHYKRIKNLHSVDTVFLGKCLFVLGTTQRCRSGLTTPVPAGFYLKDVWKSFVCNTQQFNSAQMGNCLKNKIVYMMGDSTTRQWFEYLEKNVPGKLFNNIIIFLILRFQSMSV